MNHETRRTIVPPAVLAAVLLAAYPVGQLEMWGLLSGPQSGLFAVVRGVGVLVTGAIAAFAGLIPVAIVAAEWGDYIAAGAKKDQEAPLPQPERDAGQLSEAAQQGGELALDSCGSPPRDSEDK